MDLEMTEQSKALNKLNQDVDEQIAFQKALPDAWPVQGRITSGFGWRRNPLNRNRRELHEGIDIVARYGTPIRAAGSGVVTFAGYKYGWGNMVLISHGYGYVSQYAHNSTNLVKVGQKVEKRDIIARLGNTGRSTGPHLHFGIAHDGKWINPRDLLK
jgi:murein DD-endopeptidase MepM/ murein hydrolase activator NlpD